MAECNAGARAAGVNSQKEGGGLLLFFNHLAEFLKIPINLVFVFDGAARPTIKCGCQVIVRPIWWQAHAVALIKAFGYEVHNVSMVSGLWIRWF